MSMCVSVGWVGGGVYTVNTWCWKTFHRIIRQSVLKLHSVNSVNSVNCALLLLQLF